ncbi:unnamed protein product [Clavelina lepadiformis]|uniref:Uncharacterized protein n=1 Tax=Clavelina lepadiformis TaxID=159417 RepID=A0ABP0G8W5_CLALP
MIQTTASFYAKLYACTKTNACTKNAFLKEINPETSLILKQPLAVEEMENAVKTMKKGVNEAAPKPPAATKQLEELYRQRNRFRQVTPRLFRELRQQPGFSGNSNGKKKAPKLNPMATKLVRGLWR